jgi:hypothetical protein
MKHLAILCTVFGLLMASTAFGFHEGRPENFKFEKEQSEEEVQKLQEKMKSMGEVGGVPSVGERPESPGLEGSSDDSDLIKGSTRRERGAADIRKAELMERRHEARKRSLPIFGLLFALVGFGAIFALKQYAGRITPPPPSRRVPPK